MRKSRIMLAMCLTMACCTVFGQPKSEEVKAQWAMMGDAARVAQAASEGVPVAQFLMGVSVEGRPLDSVEDEYLRLAIGRTTVFGEADADPEVSPEAEQKAYEWYRKAADGGLDIAQWRVATMLMTGTGTTKDIGLSLQWAERAAAQGFPMYELLYAAMNLYGWVAPWHFFFGLQSGDDMGTPEAERTPNLVKADQWLRKVTAHERDMEVFNEDMQDFSDAEVYGTIYYDARTDLAQACYEAKDYERAFYWATQAGANSLLGQMYLYGQGTEKDPQRAEQLFTESEDYFLLGTMYRLGEGVPANRQKAMDYLQKGAAEGNMACRYTLGFMYYDEGDYARAYEQLKEAVQYNYKELAPLRPRGLYLLGTMLLGGQGTQADKEKGLRWLKEAAALGSPEAKAALQQ